MVFENSWHAHERLWRRNEWGIRPAALVPIALVLLRPERPGNRLTSVRVDNRQGWRLIVPVVKLKQECAKLPRRPVVNGQCQAWMLTLKNQPAAIDQKLWIACEPGDALFEKLCADFRPQSFPPPRSTGPHAIRDGLGI